MPVEKFSATDCQPNGCKDSIFANWDFLNAKKDFLNTAESHNWDFLNTPDFHLGMEETCVPFRLFLQDDEIFSRPLVLFQN